MLKGRKGSRERNRRFGSLRLRLINPPRGTSPPRPSMIATSGATRFRQNKANFEKAQPSQDLGAMRGETGATFTGGGRRRDHQAISIAQCPRLEYPRSGFGGRPKRRSSQRRLTATPQANLRRKRRDAGVDVAAGCADKGRKGSRERNRRFGSLGLRLIHTPGETSPPRPSAKRAPEWRRPAADRRSQHGEHRMAACPVFHLFFTGRKMVSVPIFVSMWRCDLAMCWGLTAA